MSMKAKTKVERQCLGFLFNSGLSHVLLIKKNGGPFPGLINGLGGNVKDDESTSQAMIREITEETNGKYKVPEVNKVLKIMFVDGDDHELTVFYGIVEDFQPEDLVGSIENNEGTVSWYSLSIVLNIMKNKLAGNGDVTQFISLALKMELERRKRK